MKDGVRATPHIICLPKICRIDRLGVTPQHVLYKRHEDIMYVCTRRTQADFKKFVVKMLNMKV